MVSGNLNSSVKKFQWLIKEPLNLNKEHNRIVNTIIDYDKRRKKFNEEQLNLLQESDYIEE